MAVSYTHLDNAGASDDVEYDEYGNVIDSDNTVSPDDYESEQSSDSDSSSSSGSGSGLSLIHISSGKSWQKMGSLFAVFTKEAM